MMSRKLVWLKYVTVMLVCLMMNAATYGDGVMDLQEALDGTFSLVLPDYLELDNGKLRIRMDTLDFGGAITYLSLSDQDRNIINTYDRGREIQQSYYAGQNLDRIVDGQHPAWSPWPWNPIQVGDAYGNSSVVIDTDITDGVAYTKTIPLLWDMNNEQGECHIEQWTSLNGYSVHVRNKLTCFRTDSIWTQVIAKHQELPAVYTIGDLSNLYTYIGSSPWQDQPLTKIINNGPPWAYWTTNENWAATVDASDWGLGVYNASSTLFAGGIHRNGYGETSDPSTSYMTPIATVSLGKTSVYEYEYDIFVGSLDQIREFVYMKNIGADPATNPGPADTETDVSVCDDVSWDAGALALSHDVYFGTNPTPDAGEFIDNRTGTSYDPSALLLGTTYYWRIDEVNPVGTTTGPVWSFTTKYPVDLKNFALLAQYWMLDCGDVDDCIAIDWYFDGTIDTLDLQQLALSWLGEEMYAFKPISYWKFDEQSGILAADSIGEKHGTLVNFPTDDSQWVEGKVDGALSFDGVDDYVTVPDFSITGNEITLVAWINGSGPLYTGIIATRTPETRGMLIGAENRLVYTWNDPAQKQFTWLGGPVIPVDEWAMVAVVIEPDKATVYVYSDSAGLVSGVNSVAHDVETMADIKIGWEEGVATRIFDGLIDDVRVYDKALSQDEILWLCTNNQ